MRLGDIVEAHRTEIRRQRRLPDTVARAFVDADIYRLLIPRDLGGAGLGPLEQFDLVEEIAFRDASAGWNYAVGSGLGLFSGFMPAHQVTAMFTRETAATAGSGAPQGIAHRIEGGYRIDGTFRWASGIDQAHWVYAGCMIHSDGALARDEDGNPRALLAFVPKEQALVLEGWEVGGLVATNSTHFTLDQVFVPEERTIVVPWKNPLHPSPLFRLPRTFFGFALTAAPLGTARFAIEGLRALGHELRPARARSLAEDPFAQYALGKAQAMVEAARMAARASFEDIWQTVTGGGEADLEQCARARRACVHAAEASLEAATLCQRAAGGAAVFSDAPFESAVRDIGAMCGHVVFQRAMMEDAGRVGFGLTPILPNF